MKDAKGFHEVRGWGDLGRGFFRNPVLNVDYSDPDVIRVGDGFFMVCSDFHYMGMQVLRSTDLLNWVLIGQIYDRLNIDPRYDGMDRYGRGSWAPAIRHHDGSFFVYFCTPDEGLYMSRAKDPAGPWEPLVEVRRVAGWEDPCPFWDDDGSAYLGHSTVGAGPIVIHRMSADGTRLLDDGVIVYVGKTAEGTKIYKREGFYYLIIPEGGVSTGWQTVLRSKSIYGPYEKRIVLSQGATAVNGPHQGALIELESGETWFMHFQSAGTLGRVCHLQPVTWVDGWPEMGVDGEPVEVCRSPEVSAAAREAGEGFPPQTSDDFDGPRLGLQWQWNHNPVAEHWSLSERPGFFRIKSLQADGVSRARNCLTQKLVGERGTMTVKLSIEHAADGQICGLAYLGGGSTENWIGVTRRDGVNRLKAVADGVVSHGPCIGGRDVWLRSRLDLRGATDFLFSLDGDAYIPLGGPCTLSWGHWKGARIGLFSYNTRAAQGCADFEWFVYDVHDKASR